MANRAIELAEFANKVNKQYKSTVVGTLQTLKALKLNRFSSGILTLDLALGGGWPFHRIGLVAGDESSGKSLLCHKACSSIQNYCHVCRKFGGIEIDGKRQLSICTCSKFEPGSALWIDAEGVFDFEWAKRHNWNDEYFQISRPETAEQGLDVLEAAMRGRLFDLIVIDSIAALTPSKEIEESYEDDQMMLAAKLVNKCMRKCVASLAKASQVEGIGGPLLLFINQIRYKPVQTSYADPRVLPAGKGQIFAGSIIIYTKNQKVKDDAAYGENAVTTLSGTMRKNKTAPPKQDYEFDMALRDLKDYGIAKGEIFNWEDVVKQGLHYAVLETIGDGIGYKPLGLVAKSVSLLQDKLKKDKLATIQIWREIIKVACEQVSY